MALKSKAVFSFAGAGAQATVGDFSYFQGTYSAVLTVLAKLGLPPLHYSIHYISTNNWALFYHKPGSF